MNAYLFVFDRDSTTDYTALHEKIKSDTHINNWWHYLNSAYILISPFTANQLSDSIRTYFPNRFLIIKISKNDYQGWLPETAWEWIRTNVNG